MGEYSTKLYLPKSSLHNEVWQGSRVEIEVLHFIYNHPKLEEARGSPQKVLGLIDEFGQTKSWLMNVGESKGKIVTKLIEEVKPEVMIELGSYVGYSALLFASTLQRIGGKKYYCLEKSPEYAAITTMVLELAGLRDFVRVIVGSSDASLRKLHASGEIPKIELMFLDHYKPAYLTDLKLCEELGMIVPGTVLAADNVINPGAPQYLEYVRSTVDTKKSKAIGLSADHNEPSGNPNIVYDTKLNESHEPSGEPDGVEITRCVGFQN